MSAAGNYRAKAVELLARAETENNQTVRAEFENLAEAFLRVAEQAERDAAFAMAGSDNKEMTAARTGRRKCMFITLPRDRRR